jgi:4-alpha-glucanotransferase
MTRSSGILLHPTSLPGRYGIGDIGPEAFRFADFLKDAGQSIWQMLPIVPPSLGNAPYQSVSAFAGNPLLISLERLAENGLIDAAALADPPRFPDFRTDYNAAAAFKMPLLLRSFRLFQQNADSAQRREFDDFCAANGWWLDNFAVYQAIKESRNGTGWTTWEDDLRRYDAAVLKEAGQRLSDRVTFHKYIQSLFFRQWFELKRHCNSSGIRLIGDMPVFAALDSADVWSQPGMFYLDDRGQPTAVAGVPPDYFSKDGQLWGNPLYRWDVMKADGYKWWINRLRLSLTLFDYVRIDHFRGFEKYWEVPAGEKTARNGAWKPGPGEDFFNAVRRELGKLPIIAEDLGYITPEVEALRLKFGLPGMRVLLFAFGGDLTRNTHLPHFHTPDSVVYTGTHDNTTAFGWFRGEDLAATTEDVEERKKETATALQYLGSDGKELNWDLIRCALESVGEMAIIPLQDVMGLGNEARMNIPGTVSGNWEWRFRWNMATEGMGSRLKELARITGRISSS